MKSLLEGNPELLHARDCYDYTPLMSATRGRRLKAVEFLLEKGADPDAMTDEGETALQMTAQGDWRANLKLEMARRLLEAGADPNLAEPDRKISPLHWAAIGGNVGIVRLLLESGAHVNPRDYKGRTPLSWARDADVRQVLRNHGAEK